MISFQFKLLAVFAILAFSQARNLPNDEDAPWESEDWMRCHGQPCNQWERVKEKLNRIKIESLQSEMGWEGEVNSSLINRTDNLAECLWLTEAQCDQILEDMREARSQESSTRQKRKATFFDDKAVNKWPMPIAWKLDGSQKPYQARIIRDAFGQWADHTCVQFRELGTKEKFENNHILVTGKGSGCHSYIGRVNLIPQQLNLQPICLSEFGVAVHEMGHALGLWHEQQRSDRDQSIRILWENIGSYKGQYYKHKTNNLVPYDTSSVMHYSPKDGSKNGKNVMESLDPSLQHNMGQRAGLSFLDAKIINMLYCKDECHGKPLDRPCQQEGYQDPKDCSKCRCPEGLAGTYCEQVAPSNNPTCGGEVRLGTKAMTIQSPGYNDPGHYDLNTECNWLVKVPVGQKIRLRFIGEFGVFCHYQEECYHWVEVRHSRNLGIQAGRYCCKKTPDDVITSESNEMLIVFRSEFSTQSIRSRRGFQFRVEAVPVITATTTTTTATTTSRATASPPPTTATTTTTTTTVSTPTTTIPSTTAKPVQSGCKQLDVAFILDGSITGINWWRVLEFITSTVSQFTIGPSDVRVALVTYGSSATVRFALDRYSTMENLIRAIQMTTSKDSGSNMAQGIRVTRELVFSEDHGDRVDITNVAILLTKEFSSKYSETALAEAEFSKSLGMEIYAVGIGNQVDVEALKAIVSKPQDLIHLNNFDDLTRPGNVQRTVSKICNQKTNSSKPIWSCDFEATSGEDTLCGLTQFDTDHFDWTLVEGKTPSFGTGPESAYQGSHYIYIEASFPRKRGEAALILLPTMDVSGRYCLSFHYHMYGAHVDVLALLMIKKDNTMDIVWHRRRDQGNSWHLGKADIRLDSGDKIGFLGIRGSDYAGDIAVDQVKLYSGRCEGSENDENIFNIAADPASFMKDTLDQLSRRIPRPTAANA